MHPLRPLQQVNGAAEVSASHEQLMADLDELLSTSGHTAAASILARLQRKLPHHFAVEEARDGVFDWTLMLSPQLGPEIDALLADHKALVIEVGQLRCPVDADARVDTKALTDLQAFAVHLRKHEGRESLALQQAMEAAERH